MLPLPQATSRTDSPDCTSELLERAAEEEKIALLDSIVWKEGDAQNLPFEDESFDVVLFDLVDVTFIFRTQNNFLNATSFGR